MYWQKADSRQKQKIENAVDGTKKLIATEGSKVTPTISGTKEGFEFAGWYTDVALTKEWKADTDTHNCSFGS